MTRRSVLALALASTVLLGAPRPSAADSEPLAVGRFRVGMSFDEARAAAPDVAWENASVSSYSGKVLSIKAANAATLGGVAHDVEVAPGYYGLYTLELRHEADVTNPAECERLAVGIVAELEQLFGPLSAGEAESPTLTRSLPRFESRRMPDGSLVVLPAAGTGISFTAGSPRVRAGKESSIAFTELNERRSRGGPALRTGTARREQNDEDTIGFQSHYERVDAARATCTTRTRIEHAPPLPEREPIAFDPSLVLLDVTVAAKHHTLDVVGPPAERVVVGVACTIERGNGRMRCSADDDAVANAGRYAGVAEVRASSMLLDPAKLDPDNPVPLSTHFAVAIDPGDRRSLDFADAPPLAMRDVQWRLVPRKGDLDELYPRKTLDRGFQRDVTVACQIQVDGSTICLAVDPPPPADGMPLDAFQSFSDAAVRIYRAYVAGPTLRSGAPSAGAVVRGQVSFRLQQ